MARLSIAAIERIFSVKFWLNKKSGEELLGKHATYQATLMLVNMGNGTYYVCDLLSQIGAETADAEDFKRFLRAKYKAKVLIYDRDMRMVVEDLINGAKSELAHTGKKVVLTNE